MRICDGLLKQRIKKGDLLIGGQILDSRTSSVVEIYNDVGFDFVLIDREHTALNDETIADHVRVARCLGLPSMVRVAQDCYHELNRTLDQGPDGVFVPRVVSRLQVEEIVQKVRYRPRGIRGLCGSSVPIGKYIGWTSIAEQMESVMRNTVLGIQIETAEALEDLEGILSVPGVDIALVGNDDLTVSLGIPGQTDDPEYMARIEGVIASCRAKGVLPGIAVGDPRTAAFWIRKGMRFIWYSTDIYLLYAAAAEQLSRIHNLLATNP